MCKITLPETDNEGFAKKMREFYCSELERDKFLKNNHDTFEEELKKVLRWLAKRKKRKIFITAKIERWHNETVIVEPGKETKRYSTKSSVEHLKSVMEFINAHVLENVDIQMYKKDLNSYDVNIYFN